MPPKKAAKKTDQKVKKVVDDKTFGLKNKGKSTKVQKYVNTVKQQAEQKTKAEKKAESNKGPSKKEADKQKKEELNQIFKPVTIQQSVPVGVDPKSVVCQFFKLGQCAKGNKCKFSHDLDVERKVQKIDFYTDRRDVEGSEETMENWDQTKLEAVIEKRSENKNRNEVVCKFFVDAIENKKYGWFWNCPNGDSCIYRHALPPGFVLKSKDEKKEEKVEEDWAELLESERKKISTFTPVTLEKFVEWKEAKRKKKEEEQAEQLKAKMASKNKSGLSGREMFVFNPELFIDDDEAFGKDALEAEQDDFADNVPHNYVTVTDTSISLTRINKIDNDSTTTITTTTTSTTSTTSTTTTNENGDQNENGNQESQTLTNIITEEVNESLFNEEDLPDEDEDEENDNNDNEENENNNDNNENNENNEN
eukprot:TRINITY_DN570_c1_g1_i1.p1 TRINITY_DN570_c1_g1~~TRINITY_DN570_c1_g1_i1.p1  ORF type:complete len:421 (-),score=226.03 TRINITY_DN570_c1_g1_i1:153-1415(-)